MLVAIETNWEEETTEKSFKVVEKLLSKHKKNLERIGEMPTEGQNKAFFLANIEGYPEAARKAALNWLARTRPMNNLMFYTCHNWGTIPKNICSLTDFFFTATDTKDGIRLMIFRQGVWIEKLKDNIGRSYMKTITAKWKGNEITIRKIK